MPRPTIEEIGMCQVTMCHTDQVPALSAARSSALRLLPCEANKRCHDSVEQTNVIIPRREHRSSTRAIYRVFDRRLELRLLCTVKGGSCIRGSRKDMFCIASKIQGSLAEPRVINSGVEDVK